MGHISDEDDIPTSERGPHRQYKVGFKGFDWWWSRTHIALPLYFSYGAWWGPVGYENGAWVGWNLYVGFLVWGCTLQWTSRWEPTDPSDPEPRLFTGERPRRRRMSGEWVCNNCGHTEPLERETNCWTCHIGEMIFRRS